MISDKKTLCLLLSWLMFVFTFPVRIDAKDVPSKTDKVEESGRIGDFRAENGVEKTTREDRSESLVRNFLSTLNTNRETISLVLSPAIAVGVVSLILKSRSTKKVPEIGMPPDFPDVPPRP